MRSGFKVWHLIILICASLIILRFNYLVDTILFFIQSIRMLFKSPEFITSQLSFQFVDPIISAAILIIAAVFVLLKRKKNIFLMKKINFSSSVIIILAVFFFLAPVIAGSNPEFQKNLSVTKLLPPLSQVGPPKK